MGRGINWGFSSPHTLLPKEEKEEMNAFCMGDIARRVPLNGNNSYFDEEILKERKILFNFNALHQGLNLGKNERLRKANFMPNSS